MKRLAVISTHPIQYFAPIWRILASTPGVQVHVYYASDHSVRGEIDEQFGVPVKWDVPILDGYAHTFMTQNSVLEKFHVFFEHDRKDVDEVIRQGNFDAVLIMAYDRWLHWRALRAANRLGIPVMLRGDNQDGTNVRRPVLKALMRRCILRRLYKRIAAMLSVGEYTRRHYLEHGVSAESIFFSPHCVDDRLFSQQRAQSAGMREEIRRKLGFSDGDFVFMFSGKMIAVKNPLLISEALVRLPSPDTIGLLAVGDGELRGKFESTVRSCIGNRGVFTGFVNQSELGKFYTAADAVILPSRSETWGLVVNEAMIFGLPVIVSDSVGCREDLVIPGETGCIFHSGDPGDLAAAMTQLAEDREHAKNIGLAGAELVKGYSVEAAANGILEALECVTAEST